MSSILAERAATFWAVPKTELSVWNLPYTGFEMNRRVGCAPGENWRQYVRRALLSDRTFDSALSLGCGAGENDRDYLAEGWFRRALGVDVSEPVLALARAGAGDLPLRYQAADMNDLQVEGRFDLVYAHAALHHAENLEGLFDRINALLTPDGVFYFMEYVGPSQFQWTDDQMALSAELLDMLPDRLTGGFTVTRPDPSVFERNDPSEAIRSADIMPLVRERFETTEIDLGFTLTQPILSPILSNFDFERDEDVALCRMVFMMEDQLIAAGALDSDVKVVIARPRGGLA